MHPIYSIEASQGNRVGIEARALLGPPGCEELIALAESRGFRPTGEGYPDRYRNNDRLVVDDPQRAEALYTRVLPLLPSRLRDEDGALWEPTRLNPRFRFCRYRGGQSFRIHRDGAWSPSPDEASRWTCQIYLNDASTFTGGATRFYSSERAGFPDLGVITPEIGKAILFDHQLWHDGAPVTQGTKWVMRTDVLFRRVGSATRDLPSATDLRGHRGYVWSVLARSNGDLATGSRDCTVRTWSPVDSGFAEASCWTGHTASVTCLAESQGTLYSGSRDGTVRRWTAEGAWTLAAEHSGAVLALSGQPGGGVISAGADGRLRYGRQVMAETGSWVWSLARLGTGVAAGSEDGSVRIYDERWRLRCTLDQGQAVRALIELSPAKLALGLAGGDVRVLTPSGAPVHEWPAIHRGAVTALAAGIFGEIFSCGEDGWSHRLDGAEGIVRLGQRRSDYLTAIAALPGDRVAVGGYDGRVAIRTARPARRSRIPTYMLKPPSTSTVRPLK